MTKDSLIQQAFEVAAERYAAVGVDVRKALEDMKKISPVSYTHLTLPTNSLV